MRVLVRIEIGFLYTPKSFSTRKAYKVPFRQIKTVYLRYLPGKGFYSESRNYTYHLEDVDFDISASDSIPVYKYAKLKQPELPK